LRSRAAQNQQALQLLAKDSESTDDNKNTQIAVLNKINAANVIMAKQIQDTNQLLLTMLEQMTLQSAELQRERAAALNGANRRKSFTNSQP